MSQTQMVESSQHSYILPLKKQGNQKHKESKTKKASELSVEIELIEKALTIPDVPVKKSKKTSKKQINDAIDPTMAINMREITIVEKVTPLDYNSCCVS